MTAFRKGCICYLWHSSSCSLGLCAKIIRQIGSEMRSFSPPPTHYTQGSDLGFWLQEEPARPSLEHHQSLHPWRKASHPSTQEPPAASVSRAEGFQQAHVCQGVMSSSLVTRPHFYLRLEKQLNGFHTPPQPILPAARAKGLSEVSLGKSRGGSCYSAGSASPASLQGRASGETVRYFYLDGNSTKCLRTRR